MLMGAPETHLPSGAASGGEVGSPLGVMGRGATTSADLQAGRGKLQLPVIWGL